MAQILLLEDDAALSWQIRSMLELEGHEVSCFKSAATALCHFEQNPVDLVITDLFIQRDGKYVQDGGISLISNIRQIKQSPIPVIAISGSFGQMHAEGARSTATTVGASALLAKPFHPDELSDLVRDHLDRRSVAQIA